VEPLMLGIDGDSEKLPWIDDEDDKPARKGLTVKPPWHEMQFAKEGGLAVRWSGAA
ncbi:hypothetical protein FRC00_012329, partial [Tulasnella sp. 408]